MKHFSSDKLDLYVLNQKTLGDEVNDIEKHLSLCDTCSEYVLSLKEFYKETEIIPDPKITQEKINEVTKTQQFELIQDYNSIFKKIKKENFIIAFYKNSFDYFDRKALQLKKFLSPIFDISPAALKWSLASSFVIVIAIIIISILPSDEGVRFAQHGINVDTLDIINHKEIVTPYDSTKIQSGDKVAKQTDKGVKEHLKPEVIHKSDNLLFGLSIPILLPKVRGKMYDLYSCVDRNHNTAALLVFDYNSTKNI